MKKEEVLYFLMEDHEKLVKAIDQLTKEQIMGITVIGKWTTKDIITHITAWVLEITESIDQILENEKPWYVNEENLTEKEFNDREVERRKDWPLERVLEEWQESFDSQIERIQSLTEQEWEKQTNLTWQGGSPITMASLFGYRYKGAGHEGGHASQIVNFFNLKNDLILHP